MSILSGITKKIGKRYYLKVPIFILIILFPFLVSFLPSSNYIVLIACFILIYIIAVSGLDVLLGYSGQISLGHAGFFAIGAYGSAILNKTTGLNPIISSLISCIVAVLVAAIIAFPAAKLKLHFLSLATIAFGEIIYSLISASPGKITGNFVGYFPNKMSIFGFELDTYTKFFYFGLAVVIIMLILKQNIVKSKTGRGFIAIRENVVAASGMGINVRRYKILAFAISAFYVALAGALYGHLVGYINPATFMFEQSVLLLTMLLFGGSGTLMGPVVGVVTVQIINEVLRSFEKYQTMFYGIFLLAVVVFMPRGLVNIRFKKQIGKNEVKKHAEN